MIGRLTGRLVDCEPGSAVLDVGGVGYELRIPLSTYYRLSARPDPAVLFVHTHVREDALALFGFATREERAAFERLISEKRAERCSLVGESSHKCDDGQCFRSRPAP